MKYGHMTGAHDEGIKDNPAVRSKFDKSQGRGLPAPHLKHPGEVAKETGSSYPGHSENGHKLPVERSVGLGGSHLRHSYTPGEMGDPLISGAGQGHAKNVRLTDGNVVKSSHNVSYGAMQPHLREPDPVSAGSIKEPAKSGFGNAHGKGSESKYGSQEKSQRSHPQKMEDSSTRRRSDAGALAGDSGSRNSYTGGRGKIR